MISPAYAQQMAAYNRWMNDKLYQQAAALDEPDLHRENGAYFGSLFGTLNHILVGDTLWLQRFATLAHGGSVLAPLLQQPEPPALDTPLAANLAELAALRQPLDALIVAWAASLDDTALAQQLAYRNKRGEACCKPFAALLVHFFNHQTHHRGQASTQLSQLGRDIGVTDLLVLLPDSNAGRN